MKDIAKALYECGEDYEKLTIEHDRLIDVLLWFVNPHKPIMYNAELIHEFTNKVLPIIQSATGKTWDELKEDLYRKALQEAGDDPIIKMDHMMEDVRVDTYRAKGQRLNEQNSGVRMTHNPTGIVVQCQSERGQHKNRAVAISMLKSRLYEYYTGVDDEV